MKNQPVKLRLVGGTKLRALADLQPEINSILDAVVRQKRPVPIDRAHDLARAWRRLGGFDAADRVLRKPTVHRVITMCLEIQHTLSFAEPSIYVLESELPRMTGLSPTKAKGLSDVLPIGGPGRKRMVKRADIAKWALGVAMRAVLDVKKTPVKRKPRLRAVRPQGSTDQ
jgi:hypothetical protein